MIRHSALSVAIVLALSTGLGGTHAFARGGGAIGGGGGTGGGLPPSITEPGWGKDSGPNCYQSRRVHTEHGLRWRRVWTCN